MDWESPYNILHPSFTDFLMTRTHCGRDIWFFNPSEHHQSVAFQCLIHMDTILKRNMCNMTLSIDLLNESLPEDVSYACEFWIDHICVIEKDLGPVIEWLHVFLFQHLLHWFEAMSILRRCRGAITLVQHLSNWILVRHCHDHQLLKCTS
jgi:hypothetical protein